MLTLLLSLLVGGGVGAALGYYGRCSAGTCPLTANWRRGAAYGAFLGLVVHLTAAETGNASDLSRSTQNVKAIGADQFQAEVVHSTVPVVVDFYATWCVPCKKLSPMLDELAGPLSRRIKFVKIDIDQASALADRLKIDGVPTVLLFKNGKEVDRVLGLMPEKDLKAKLETLAR